MIGSERFTSVATNFSHTKSTHTFYIIWRLELLNIHIIITKIFSSFLLFGEEKMCSKDVRQLRKFQNAKKKSCKCVNVNYCMALTNLCKLSAPEDDNNIILHIGMP
jgi:hypothetical protein